jgi:NAD(P)-dependent dehydrogenase (short-subunit alcohol dehydrogenase family)
MTALTDQAAVVTGAGSGVGRAVALALAREGWRVALVGRRPEPLAETVKLALADSTRMLVWPCDIGDPHAVEQMGQGVLSSMGEVELLVNAAGTNFPRRALEVLSLDDYQTMMNTNLHGAYHCAQTFLPQMRARGSGTIVNVVSDAGKQASPKAGPAYVMSKFGLAGLTQSINAEERGRGIRACAIFPGDIDTPLLERRPAPPDATARARMLRGEDVAECVMFCVRMGAHAIVEELVVRPR